MTAIFLWHNVVLMQILHRTAIQSMTRSSVLVTVALLRSHAIIRSLRKILVEEYTHTESRKFWELCILAYLHGCGNSS